MTDDVRSALHDLAGSADLRPLSPAGACAAATSRRRRRRALGGATAAVLLLAAPLAWSAVPERDDVVVEDIADEPASDAEQGLPAGPLVSGMFELRYDGGAYDDRSDAALDSCDGLAGLRNTGLQLDSLPPIRSFWFAGTTSQRDAAARCLEAMPAAVVTFKDDGHFVPVVMTAADLQGPGRLSVGTSTLRPSSEGWLEHDLIVMNEGTDALVVDLESLSEVMGGSIAATSGRCSPVPPSGFACGDAPTPRVIGPGESATTTVQLQRDLPGLSPLEPGTSSLTWTQEVADLDGSSLGELAVTLEYEVLTAARSPVPVPVPPPPGDTQTVQVFFSATAQGEPSDYCNGVVAVPRQVPTTEAVATAALNELFRGPSPEEEQAYGAGSAFTRETADLLRSVHVEEGVAYVDLRPFDEYAGTDAALGSYGTSCGSVAFHAQVKATLRQFPTVEEVRFAFDGDPRAFVEYMQGGCPDPVPAGDPCDPEPFR